MDEQHRSFSAEFKLEAASLVIDQDYSFSEASRSLNIGETVLRRWVKQREDERNGSTPSSKALTPEQQKIQELKLGSIGWREKSHFKKATALLMSEEFERMR
jgi:transposase